MEWIVITGIFEHLLKGVANNFVSDEVTNPGIEESTESLCKL
jgi:hypothetical protein